MKVKTINIQNLRQIDSISLSFDGCTAIVTGGNNKGKTTILRSIIERLRGDNTNILQDGKLTGKAEWTFTDNSTLTWDVKEKSDKIVYTTSDQVKTSSIRDICAKLFGKGFDIDTFLQSTPKDQKRILQDLVGLDFTELDAQYQVAYENRSLKNSELKIIRSKSEGLVQQPTKSSAPIDISSLQQQMQEAITHNSNIKTVEAKLEQKQYSLKDITETIAKLQAQQKELQDDIDNGNLWLQGKELIDTTGINQQITDAIEENKAHEYNNTIKENLAQIKVAEHEAIKADEQVKLIEDKKKFLIQSAKLPQGFDFTDDGITFNGYPLDRSHLSSSQTYIAGLMLASMNLGEVQALTFDASYLDKDSLESINDRADAQGLQLLIERPDFDGGDIKYEIIQTQ